MGNYSSTKAEINNYIRARTPLIIVDSSERERVERILKEILILVTILIPNRCVLSIAMFQRMLIVIHCSI